MAHERTADTTARPGADGFDADTDVVVVGAGISGIFSLYRLHQAGYRVRLLEAGHGVGGTWFWNRYPGARFDVESHDYAYTFSEDLFTAWRWSELFAGQPEIERYLNWVVDELGLREHICLDSRVVSAQFDSDPDRWVVTTESGESVSARFVVMAIGILSHPKYPEVPGLERFSGPSFHTARWPSGDLELDGRRVAVVGTSSSGVQVVQTLAPRVAHLYVLQRTAQWCTPLNNRPLSDADHAGLVENFAELRDQLARSRFGSRHDLVELDALSVGAQEREAFFDSVWHGPGFAKIWGNYQDIAVSEQANREFSQFLADRIRERVADPETARKLIPTDHGFGVRRPPYETNYYEAFNRDNVTLVDLADTPLEAIEPTGFRTSDGLVEVDALIYATGFDVGTGIYRQIDIRNGDGHSLRDAWADGPSTYLSVATPGFPNLFLVGGPHTPTINFPRATEPQAEFVVQVLDHAHRHGATRVQCSIDDADDWTRRASESPEQLLAGKAKKDWLFGVNVPGKPRVYQQHVIALGEFWNTLGAVADDGFPGFRFDTADGASSRTC